MERRVRRMRFALALLFAGAAFAQSGTLRVIAFGAHPDDCDIKAGGTAALYASMGHKVKFVAVTNGDAGHPKTWGEPLAKRRLGEAKEAARRLGIEYDVMNNHDGLLMPTLENRLDIIRKIREWNADVVLAPRPNDYHPDHRYTGVLVQDAAYMVMVPAVVQDTPPLKRNPVFLYFEDGFQKPNPFRPDVVVALDKVIDKKIEGMDAHASQFYEYQTSVGADVAVPADPQARKKWLLERRTKPIAPAIRAALVKWYGADKATPVKHYEAFEVCEYGSQPDDKRIRELFPMLGK